MQRLLALILDEQKHIDAEYPFDEKATITAVKAFYAQHYGWNPTPKNLDEKDQTAKGAGGLLRLSDFPPELHHQLEGAYIHEVRDTTDEAYYQQFDLSNWKEARVRMEKWKDGILPFGAIPFQNAYVISLYPAKDMLNFSVGLPHLQKQAWTGRPMPDDRIILTDAPANAVSTAAQASPAPEGHEVAPALAPVTDAPVSLDIDAEAALQKQVSFDAVRVPLQKFVADLSKQSGVTLALSPELAQGKTLVAHSAGMTLAEAMKSLGRLYIGHWAKDGQSYTLSPDTLDELHLLMAQMGNNAYYGYHPPIPETGGRDEIGAELADEIYGDADPGELQSAQGIAFTSLPEDLQERLVQLFRDDHMGYLMVMQQRLIDAQAQDIRIVFAPLPPKRPLTLFGGAYTQGANFGTLGVEHAGLAAFTPDGRFITQLLEGLEIRPSSPSEREAQKQRKIDHEWAVQHWHGPGQPPQDPDNAVPAQGQPQ